MQEDHLENYDLIRDLSSQLRQLVITDATSGTITNLSELGISFDNSGKMTVEDSDKLETVLVNTPSDLNTSFQQVVLLFKAFTLIFKVILQLMVSLTH